MGQIFYKRRLACYNFTVYEIENGTGHCYFWHEGIGGRGSNAVSSLVHHFLQDKDRKSAQVVHLFADGCGGQNKNSIVPAMFMHFLNHSAQNIKQIYLYFFETNHGQAEGDSMHSTIERTLSRCNELFLPSELSVILKLARKTPYNVKDVTPNDILDWKAYSIEQRILRVRLSDEGHSVDWTKMMQIMVDQSKSDKIFYKTSHLVERYSTLSIGTPRRSSTATPAQDLKPEHESAPPKLSQAKYDDLMSLCRGRTPVIRNPDHQAFYQQLPH